MLDLLISGGVAVSRAPPSPLTSRFDRILRPQCVITVAKDTEKPDPGPTIARNQRNIGSYHCRRKRYVHSSTT
jgi:hypothetical protein